MGRNVLVFAAVVVLCCITCFASTQLTDDSQICDSKGNCYPKVFVPTNEFQEIREGQQIPPGLHVRVDFPTGRKEAKLPVPNSHVVTDVVIIDDTESDTCNGDSRDGEPSPHCDGTSERKVTFHKDAIPGSLKPKDGSQPLPFVSGSHHKPNIRIPQSDYELFEAYLVNITTPHIAVPDLVLTLEGLEYLVHELDFGIKLAEGDGLFHVVALLEHQDRDVKKKAAVVVGTALQNNPIAQTAALRLNLVQRILNALAVEQDVKVSARLLYALSSVVRGSNAAIKSLQQHKGLMRLAAFYAATHDDGFHARCAVFITDFLDPNMAVAVSAPSSVMVDQSGNEDSSTLAESDDEVMSTWCGHFQSTLLDAAGRPSLDVREKVLRGLLMVKQRYPLACRAQNRLQLWLVREREKVMGDEDFVEYYQLVEKAMEQYGWRS